MRVFYNDDRSGYDEIVSYGPRWWTEYREMDAIYRFAGWTLDLMAYWMDRLVNNQFPLTADEATIRLYEIMLGIDPDPESSLDERRRMVLLYYSGTGKLSKSVIQSLIKSYTGCDSDVSWDGLTFRIAILGEDGPQYINDKLLQLFRRRMPAHISYSVAVEETIRQTEYVAMDHRMVPHMVVGCETLNYYYLRTYIGVGHVSKAQIVLH